jgi:hypothetical protein
VSPAGIARLAGTKERPHHEILSGLLVPGIFAAVLAVFVAFSVKMANNWERFVILRAQTPATRAAHIQCTPSSTISNGYSASVKVGGALTRVWQGCGLNHQ